MSESDSESSEGGASNLRYIRENSKQTTSLKEDLARISVVRSVQGTAKTVSGAEEALHKAGEPEKNAEARQRAQAESARLKARSEELALRKKAREGTLAGPSETVGLAEVEPNMDVIKPLNSSIRIEPTSVGPIPNETPGDLKERTG